MGSESRMRSFVTSALRPLDAHPVENPVFPGTPDVEFIGGWVELKWVDLPDDESLPLRVPHYTKQQRAWARIRAHRGGLVMLLIRAGRYWVLMDGEVAARLLGEAPIAKLIEFSWMHFVGRPKPADLLLAFQSRIKAWERCSKNT